MDTATTEALAEKVRAALDSGNLEQFSDLLDPQVTWGPPGDPSPPCQNRGQVLAWYAQGLAAGRRGHVDIVTTRGDKILLALTVTAPDQPDTARWQVLTVADGRVIDIRGYDNEPDTLAAAGS